MQEDGFKPQLFAGFIIGFAIGLSTALFSLLVLAS